MKNALHIEIVPMHANMGERWPLPAQASLQAAGMDLVAALDRQVVLAPCARHLVPCGFAIALPEGYEAQIRPRSGLAFKFGLTCLNSPGTIDADYRGQVHALIINLGQNSYTIVPGSRIAQMVIAPLPQVVLRAVDALPETTRGTGGFGSTGV